MSHGGGRGLAKVSRDNLFNFLSFIFVFGLFFEGKILISEKICLKCCKKHTVLRFFSFIKKNIVLWLNQPKNDTYYLNGP